MLSESNKGTTTGQKEVLISFSTDPADSCKWDLFFNTNLSQRYVFFFRVRFQDVHKLRKCRNIEQKIQRQNFISTETDFSFSGLLLKQTNAFPPCQDLFVCFHT